jgi:hypothetical protein
MKLSVSLSERDVEVLDGYVQRAGLPSRSAGVQRAVRMLAYPTLEDDYDNAWAQWSAAAQDEVWENTAGDGLADATR